MEGLKPTVLWAQRSDTVILTVSLTDIKKEKISLEDSVFKFSGCGGSEGKFYDVELKFYGDVVPQESKNRKTDRGIYFVIKKKEQGPYWPRLLRDKKKPSYVKTDFGRWKDEDESEDEAESPYQDNNLNSLMQQMGGAGGGGMGMPGMGGMGGMGMPGMGGMGGMGMPGMPGMGGMGIPGMDGMGGQPNLDDLEESDDSDDEPLPELEA